MLENVLKAIDLARDYGKCQYVNESGESMCVVAQLMVIEGIDMSYFGAGREGEFLNNVRIDGFNNQATPEQQEHPIYQSISGMITRYGGVYHLSQLQDVWDQGGALSTHDITESEVEKAREDMRGVAREFWE